MSCRKTVSQGYANLFAALANIVLGEGAARVISGYINLSIFIISICHLCYMYIYIFKTSSLISPYPHARHDTHIHDIGMPKESVTKLAKVSKTENQTTFG